MYKILNKKLSETGELKNYNIIHFATHGIAVPEFPELSALVLSCSPTSRQVRVDWL